MPGVSTTGPNKERVIDTLKQAEGRKYLADRRYTVLGVRDLARFAG